jgi:UDP-hydrolysing UDP-N-acetyl-D-glucosamine 2-epimerase
MLLLLGDRIEIHAAAAAAVPFRLPVAHIHGGELTLGAIDDCLRHSITKLAHLHFVATERYRVRILQMGEEAWRVVTSGAPGVDAVLDVTPLKRGEIEARLGLDLSQDPFIVTFHPATLEPMPATAQVNGLLAALCKFDRPIVITGPNADAGSGALRTLLQKFTSSRENARFVENLDTPFYVGLMRIAAAMVGNSSSGLIEAPSFGLPVVNIGERQAGRVRGENVIDVSHESSAIEAAIRRALEPGLRRRLASAANPYGDGGAAERIVGALERSEPRDRLLRKQFQDLDIPSPLRLTA